MVMKNEEYLLGRITALIDKLSRKKAKNLNGLRDELISVLTMCQSDLLARIEARDG
jgi:hypothetical protein